MKLNAVEFDLNWPNHIPLNQLRNLIIKTIAKKGDCIRWSISNIEIHENSVNTKMLKINAVIIV